MTATGRDSDKRIAHFLGVEVHLYQGLLYPTSLPSGRLSSFPEMFPWRLDGTSKL